MSNLDYYIHDHPDVLRFAINGDLSGPGVASLDQAWQTASSVLRGRVLVIDLVSLRDADEYGRDLLLRWHRGGARISARSVETRAFAEAIIGAPISMLAGKPGWRQGLIEFLLRHSGAAVGRPARAKTTGTACWLLRR